MSPVAFFHFASKMIRWTSWLNPKLWYYRLGIWLEWVSWVRIESKRAEMEIQGVVYLCDFLVIFSFNNFLEDVRFSCLVKTQWNGNLRKPIEKALLLTMGYQSTSIRMTVRKTTTKPQKITSWWSCEGIETLVHQMVHMTFPPAMPKDFVMENSMRFLKTSQQRKI